MNEKLLDEVIAAFRQQVEGNRAVVERYGVSHLNAAWTYGQIEGMLAGLEMTRDILKIGDSVLQVLLESARRAVAKQQAVSFAPSTDSEEEEKAP